MKNAISAIAAFTLALAIVLGAWNAHGMEKFVVDGTISFKYIKTFHTGVEYLFINALGILFLGTFIKNTWLKAGIFSIFSGMFIFCFSLFILSFNEVLGNGFKILGAVAPFGGILMAAGWIIVGFSFLKNT